MPRGRSDSTLTALQRRAAVELADRSSRGGGPWAAITIDTSGQPGSGFLRPGGNAPGSADVLVFLSFQRDNSDSVKLSISVRNADPAANFGIAR